MTKANRRKAIIKDFFIKQTSPFQALGNSVRTEDGIKARVIPVGSNSPHSPGASPPSAFGI
jgi:hypothetical protein